MIYYGESPRIEPRPPVWQIALAHAAHALLYVLMAALPVKLMIHPQPGLFGAAAATAIVVSKRPSFTVSMTKESIPSPLWSWRGTGS